MEKPTIAEREEAEEKWRKLLDKARHKSEQLKHQILTGCGIGHGRFTSNDTF